MGGLRRRQKGSLLYLSCGGREWLSFKGLAAEMSSSHVMKTDWLEYERLKTDLEIVEAFDRGAVFYGRCASKDSASSVGNMKVLESRKGQLTLLDIVTACGLK